MLPRVQSLGCGRGEQVACAGQISWMKSSDTTGETRVQVEVTEGRGYTWLVSSSLSLPQAWLLPWARGTGSLLATVLTACVQSTLLS